MTRQRGDIETNDTTAHLQQRTTETGITSAPENCTKNAHFSPAKAMVVSSEARPARAKATPVSDKRAAWPTGPGCGARGRRRALHPLRGDTPDQNGCNAYGSGAMPTDRVHRTTLEYPKEESAAPHPSPVDRNTRSHKTPKNRRHGGRRRDRRAWLRCPWAAAGPGRTTSRRAQPHASTPSPTGVEGAGGTGGHGRASRRRIEPHVSTPGPTGVEGAGGTGGHGRASRRGAERSEDA